MSEYKMLLEKKRELDAQIDAARKNEWDGAINKARAIITEFGLAVSDVFPSRKGHAARSSAPVAPKYRDPLTGKTWSGRGKPPLWIADKDRAQFAL